MSRSGRKPDWMPQEEWDEWVAGEEQRERDLWEVVKFHEARAAKRRAEAEAAAARREKLRRFFRLLPR
jgi:hypothetical protein